MTRLWLSGSAGTGKSTLGRALAARLELPYIEEGMRRRLEGGLDLHAIQGADYDALLLDLASEQREAEGRALQGFVADRSPADFAAFAMHYGSLADRDFTERYVAECLARLNENGRLVVLPWGVLPLVHDGVRSTDRWLQFRFQAIVEGLIARFADPSRVLWLGAHATRLEERLELILSWLGSGERPVE